MADDRQYYDDNDKLIMPKTLDEIDGTFVMTYCKEQGQEAVDWLKEIYARPKKPDKNGVMRDISFIEVRNDFAREYFPHLAPKKKKKKETIKSKLNNL